MKAPQVQAQLLAELESLTFSQRLLLVELIRSLRSASRLEPLVAQGEHGPLKLHFSTASPNGTWSREEIYGDDGR